LKVLITRPQPDAEAFAEHCRREGLEPVVAPLIAVKFVDDWTAPARAGALAFTSANGVRAFASHSRVRSLAAFCVGAATADTAAEAGFSSISVANGDVDSLAALIAKNAGALPGPVIHIAGTRRAGDLVALLHENGVAAERIVAYETVEATNLPDAARAATGSGRAVAVTLFSPRTAKLFLNLVGGAGMTEALTRCRAVCLSDAVAEIAAGAAWRVIDTAKDRTAASMIALLKAGA